MAFCTKTQVRNCTKFLEDVTEIGDTELDVCIERADRVVIVDLSVIADEDSLLQLGANSKALNLLSTYKSVEIALVKLLGAARQADTVSDVQYWQKQYNELLKGVTKGDVTLNTSTEDITLINYPVIGSTNTTNESFFRRKGVPGITMEGNDEQYVDDDI